MPISPVIPGEVPSADEDASGVRAAGSPLALLDGQLLRRYLRRRDEEAFGQLVTRFGPLVYAVALRTLRDSHAAEDVFQATFLVLARDAARIRSPEAVGAWLHATAMRIARRALARRRREVPVDGLMTLADDKSLLDQISEQFEQQLVDEELQRLPVQYRAPLVLHFLEGKTCEETAAALGTTVGAARGRLQRGKRELQLRLMRRGVEVSTVMAAVVLWQSVAAAAIRPPLITAVIQGGLAITHGTSLPSACSPEAVHLAAKETAMLTTGKVLAGCAALLSTAACGWFAHAAMAGKATFPSPPPLPVFTQADVSPGNADHAEAVALQIEGALAFADETQEDESDSGGKPQLVLKYDDGRADGKRSIAGTGEMVRFTLPDKSQKLRNLRVHCSRYGYPKPPDEDAEIAIVSADGSEVIQTEFIPYSTFQRGESRWTTLRFEEPVTVPESFWVILQFNAERTKGVYVSYDTSSGGEHSRTGLPGGSMKEVNFGGDWMVQAILTKPE